MVEPGLPQTSEMLFFLNMSYIHVISFVCCKCEGDLCESKHQHKLTCYWLFCCLNSIKALISATWFILGLLLVAVYEQWPDTGWASVLHVMEESKGIVYFLCAGTKSSCRHRPDWPVISGTAQATRCGWITPLIYCIREKSNSNDDLCKRD